MCRSRGRRRCRCGSVPRGQVGWDVKGLLMEAMFPRRRWRKAFESRTRADIERVPGQGTAFFTPHRVVSAVPHAFGDPGENYLPRRDQGGGHGRRKTNSLSRGRLDPGSNAFVEIEVVGARPRPPTRCRWRIRWHCGCHLPPGNNRPDVTLKTGPAGRCPRGT